jgi:bifunctional DNA-binding transcriptional regulator/antitoxin component of YhaV-PrlF toxin-antitoxin module
MSSEVISETKISNGYLTVLPKPVRAILGAQEGDLVQWSLRGKEIMVQIRRPVTIADIAGMISHGGDAVASKKAVQGMPGRVR